jgi:hypothetical protein
MAYEQNSSYGREGSYDASKNDLGAAERVRRQAQQNFESTRQQAASGLDALVDAADAAAENLDEHDQQGLSRYVTEIADSVASLASSLRHKSVDELVHDVESIARKNPTLFIAGSLAIGLGIGRFARASAIGHSSGKNYERGANRDSKFVDETYPRNVSGDAYPESGEITQRVTEEDYLADDYAMTGGDDIGFEDNGYLDRDEEFPSFTSRKDQPLGSNNRGGNFYE